MAIKIYPEYKAQRGDKIIPQDLVIPEGNVTPGVPLTTVQTTGNESVINLPGSNVIKIRSDGTLYMEDINRLPIMSFESIKTGTLHAAQKLTVGGEGATEWRIELSGTNSTFPLRYWNGTTTKFSLDAVGNVIVSGVLTAGEIHIPSVGTGANSFHVDGNGNVWWDSISLATAPTYIKSNGEASFSGETITIGNYAGGQGAKWNQGTGIFEVLGDITADEVIIGIGNNVFKADANGIYLGNAVFASAPFRVTMAGALVASSVDITGVIKATSGYIGGTTTGWEISAGYIKSTNGDIELKGTSTSHIKAIVDASNYIQMTAASSVPRVDLYTAGMLRARLSGIGLTFYDAAGVLRGTFSGNTGGYANIDVTDLRVSSGASEVRIWSDGVRVKEGKGFFCQDETGSSYLRMFVDSSSHNGVIDFPTSDQLQIKDNSNNAIMNIYGKDWNSGYGKVAVYAPFELYSKNGFPASSEGAIYWHSGTHEMRVFDGTVWRTVSMV
jgi:hypothetical protein